jgi:hypothetical protein
MPPKRKITFDAEAAKAQAKKMKGQQDACMRIQQAGLNFIKQVQNCDDPSTYDSLDSATFELLLVAKIGLAGVHWLNLSSKIVPKNYPNRSQVIVSMLTFVLCENKPLQSNLVEMFIKRMDQSFPLEDDSLQRYMMDSGQPTLYLTPPVSSCINSACDRCGKPNSLFAHHAETMIVAHDFDGPKPAFKQALKCRSCMLMYGWKQTIGEKFYDTERDYVEVTDTVFCSRKFHHMYCYLQ